MFLLIPYMIQSTTPTTEVTVSSPIDENMEIESVIDVLPGTYFIKVLDILYAVQINYISLLKSSKISNVILTNLLTNTI